MSSLPLNNTEPASSLSHRLSGAGDKLKKLQLNKKEAQLIQKETSTSKLINTSDLIINTDNDFEEIMVTIRKSERGFGFELKNGVLVVKVFPNTPAFYSGIQVGDIILKVNGTCVKSKEQIEITNMIHESNSFVSLTLQRRISFSNPSTSYSNLKHKTEDLALNDNKQMNDLIQLNLENNNNKQTLKNVTNQLNNSKMNLSDDNNNTNSSLNQKTTSQDDQDLDANNSYMNNTEPENEEEEEEELLNDENNSNNIAGLIASSADSSTSKLTEFINNISQNNEEFRQTHRKQHSMSDESSAFVNQHLSLNNRRTIKKTRSTTNPKNFNQTQSLSNISIPVLNHSASDNEQIKPISIDTEELFDYKEDLSYTSEDNLHEASNDKLLFDMSGYNDYNQLVTKPINLSILLKYILGTENESPKYLYFCLFVDDLLNTNDKKEFVRWAYELYTTFLEHNAPLKIKSNEMTCKKIEDLFDRNPNDNISQLKKLFDEIKQEAVEVVNNQLNRFRDVKQMGLANLFYGTDLSKINQNNKYDFDSMKSSIVDCFGPYINELGRDILKLNNEWNGSIDTAHLSALVSSFATFSKRLGLPLKQIGKLDLDKIPMFLNKKPKLKKSNTYSIRNHMFVDYLYINTKTLCSKCNQPFWGIGYQGVICQKSKCEMKLHRHCLHSGAPNDCHGSQKISIKTDYKDKFDIQKIFGFKKKDEEQTIPMDISTSATTKNTFFSNMHESQTSLNGEGNLPVDVAIKKFESLNAKKSTSLIQNSPTGNQSMTRSNSNQNSGSSSPNNNLNRHNSLNNSITSPSNGDYLASLKRDNHLLNHEILPNKPLNNNNNNNIINNISSNNNNSNSREQACKRVGSLKVDVKKPKSNVTRSKSDPEPDEIKQVISSGNSNYRFNERISVEPGSILTDLNESLGVTASLAQAVPSYKATASPGTLSHQNSSIFNFSQSSSTLPNTNQKTEWMNDSDMEVDEELPNLSVNIDRPNLEQLTRKQIKTQEVINELIHTEQKHVRNLKIMKNHFYVPIRVNMYLTNEERDILFPNLEQVLEIHSKFNNKLKQLRKENPIVPVKQLIKIILEQFKGEEGEKFQTACAKFCENQSQAMKLLQIKLKNNEKFSQFITGAENHPICRKLQLKDFIPFEVQRLLKYRLLFNELTKTATDQEEADKLRECVEASSKISSYVNKAVTECENRKRTEEIQSRIDTKEFDQYCSKTPLLNQYRYLDLRSRKLIYEGELEWKISNTTKHLTALLFEDILVFLEKSTDEKRRYILKPLTYLLNKSKQFFTPVIPLIWIERFSPMAEKRQFHLIVILKEKDSKESTSSLLSKAQINNQILFIFQAKSGDERNKWCSYLQELTNKMSHTDRQTIDLTLNRQQSSSSSLSHSSSNSTLSQNVPLLNTSVSTSALNNNNISLISDTSKDQKEIITKQPGSDFIETKEPNEELVLKLKTELNENSKSIYKLFKERQLILSKLTNCGFSLDEEEDFNLLNDQANSSIFLLNSFLKSLIDSSDFKNINSNLRLKLNKNLDNLNSKLNQSEPSLPNLKLPLINTSRPVKNACQLVNKNSELVSSSIISSNSNNNADLSEDEQINYYDEVNEPEARTVSNSSDQTLVVMPNNLIITESVDLNHQKKSKVFDKVYDIPKFKKVTYKRNFELDEDYEDDEQVEDDDDEDEEDEVHTNSVLINEEEQDEDEYRTPENEGSETNLFDKKTDSCDMIAIQIRPLEDLDQDYRVPTPPTSEPPSLPLNSYSADLTNDLSDDEIKEYVFKENLDEDNFEQSTA